MLGWEDSGGVDGAEGSITMTLVSALGAAAPPAIGLSTLAAAVFFEEKMMVLR